MIYWTVKKYIWNVFRKRINKKNINRLRNITPTIISSNCNGGVILHDLGLQFLTPTINLFMYPECYIKFVKNMKYYILISDNMILNTDLNLNYPVGQLSDIVIHFMHENSFEEAKEKWIKRSKRINWDNIFLMMSERDGCTLNQIQEFDSLPYNKVIFTHIEYPNIKSSFYIPGFEKNDQVGVLSDKKNIFGKRYLDDFDYVEFLNMGIEG